MIDTKQMLFILIKLKYMWSITVFPLKRAGLQISVIL